MSKDIEEHNRMGKTRGLFKKIRDTKGRFHAKIGTIKDRKSMDLPEAEDIKKRWQEYTAVDYKVRVHVLFTIVSLVSSTKKASYKFYLVV